MWLHCLSPFLPFSPHHSWSHWSFTAGLAAEGQGDFGCNRARRREGTDTWRPCGKSTGGWAPQQGSITIPRALGGGPKDHCWGMHWEKSLSFSTSPICPQSFLTFVELEDPIATKLLMHICSWLPLPLDNGEKILQKLTDLHLLTGKRCSLLRTRGTQGYPDVHR